MATWSAIYLIVGILVGALGLWNLARGGDPYLCVTAILWFFIVLFNQHIPGVWNFVLVQGLPSLGSLLLYLALPVMIGLSIFRYRGRL